MTGVSSGRCQYRTTEDADPKHVYANVLVAIDASRSLNNGEPAGLARWIDRLDLQAGERVLHVDAGTGYDTALMADIVGERGRVLAIEIDPELARLARANLAHLNHVEVCEGDGARIRPGAVDAIFINAGCTHPQTIWLDALTSRGRMLIPITAGSPATGIGIGGMFLIARRSDEFIATYVSPVAIFHCLGSRDAALNQELSRKRGFESTVRSLRRDPHEIDPTCWLHTQAGCFSSLGLESKSSRSG